MSNPVTSTHPIPIREHRGRHCTACFDHDGRLFYANTAMLDLIGRPLTALIGLSAEAAWQERILPGQTENNRIRRCQIQVADQRIINASLHRLYLDPETATKILTYELDSDHNPAAENGDIHTRSSTWESNTGELQAIINSLAQLLDVRYAFLGECSPPEEDQVRTRLMWQDDQFISNVTYPLAGTPCERVIGKSRQFFSDQTWQDFPRDPMLRDLNVACYLGIPLKDSSSKAVGHLGIMHDQPKPENWRGEEVLQRFASRVSTLLERCIKSEKEAKETSFLKSLRQLTKHLDQISELDDMLNLTVDQLGKIFASEHVWLARPGERIDDDSAIWVECRRTGASQQKLLIKSAEMPGDHSAWLEIRDKALAKAGTLMTQLPPTHSKQPHFSEISCMHWVLCLQPRTGPAWLLGMLPGFHHSKAEKIQDLARFEDIALKINASLSQLLLFTALDTSHQRYKSLVETLGEIIFQTDANQRLRLLNPAWRNLTGWSVEAGLGRHLGDLFAAEDQPINQRALQEMQDPNITTSIWELRLATADNQFKWVQVHAAPNYDMHGQYLGLSGTIEDVTLRKNVEMALRQGENHFRTLVEKTPRIAVQGYDRNLKIVAWNSASQEIFGYNAQQAMGQSLAELVLPPEAEVAWRQGLHRWLEEGVTLQPGEITWRNQAQQPVTIFASHALLKNADGEPEFYTIGVDLTEQKQMEGALKESERRYRTLVELSPQAIFLIAKQSIIFANPAAIALLGASSPEEILNRQFANMVPQSQSLSLKNRLEEIAKGHGESSSQQELEDISLLRLNGQHIDVEMIAISVTYVGKPAIQVIAHDITQRKKAEEALRQSEARYALAAQGANDGLWDWDLVTDQVYYSPRWQAMLGLEVDAPDNSPNFWLDRVHPQDRPGLHRRLDAHLNNQSGQFESEHRIKHRDGNYRWMHCRGVAVFDEMGVAKRMAGSLRDITKRKKVERQLFHDAFHDSLTGLANRALFMEHLNRVLKKGKSQNKLMAIVFIDFDRFKLVNDSLGHLVGDKLLVAIAKRLNALLPVKDLFARLGGDEFAVLIEDIETPTEAGHRAEAIHRDLDQPFLIDNNEMYTSVSIGIAFGTPGSDDPVDVLRDADIAMYRAKAKGKAQSVVFDQTMHEEVQRMMTLENDLRKAMDHQEFVVYFQPIFDLRSLKLAGFEALLRWNHPTNGMILPDAFIELAEETGIILPLGLAVLRTACEHIVQLHRSLDPTLFLHVNLSFRQIMEADLKGEIETILRQTEFPANRLKLELTESVVAKPGDPAIDLLNDLRQLGILLCLDDFGTGYASLSYLHRLPLDSLKIDKSFIDQFLVDEDRKEIVPTIITLAHNLGLSVVAEGVETESQFRKLVDLGCEFAQGFFLGKPVAAEHAPEHCKHLFLQDKP